MDIIVTDMDFSSELFKKYSSKRSSDGGFVPGELVFGEDLERYSGKPFDSILEEFRSSSKHIKENLGGPAAVSLVHLGQMLGNYTDLSFYQNRGNDYAGDFLSGILKKNGVKIDHYTITKLPSPRTLVLSDPTWDDGNGDRCFGTYLGAMEQFKPEDLDNSFYTADICIYAASALSPKLHYELPNVLKKARNHGSLNLVFTVYDFFSEKKNPGGRWQLGEDDKGYQYTDLLAVDLLEAKKMSGCKTADTAIRFFRDSGCPNIIITDGSRPITFYLSKGLFKSTASGQLPVPGNCDTSGDTTGCGDNFAGGIVTSLARQMENTGRKSGFDGKSMLIEALCTGSFACSYAGGVFHESYPGEKEERIMEMISNYRE